MSDTNAPIPTVDNRVNPDNAPEPDHNLAGTDDVPSSKAPEDIRRDLASSPELKTAEDIQKRLQEVSDAYKKALEDALTIDPGNVEAVALNQKLQDDLVREGQELSERFKKLSANANGMKLSVPGLDKAYEGIMKLLEMFLELIKGALRKLGIQKSPDKEPDAPDADGQQPGQPTKQAGAVSGKPLTSEEVETTIGGALSQGGKRLETIKEENAKTEAAAERKAESDGLGVRTPKL